MLLQFILENTHFALNLVAALVFFAIFWLYFDAWTGRKALKEVPRLLGFLLLTLSFIAHAVFLETSLIQDSLVSEQLHFFLLLILRVPAYIFIIIALVINPLQKKPEQEAVKSSNFGIVFTPVGFIILLPLAVLLYPVLAVAVGILYLKRASVGLENHLKPVGIAFLILGFFELLSVSSIFRDTSNIDIYNLVAAFGPIWILEHIVLLIAVALLGRWVFGYLLKRLQTQLFMFFTTFVLFAFLFITVTFTSLILNNLVDETLVQLETNVKVLNFALESKKAESLSDAQVVAQNPQVQQAVVDKNRSELFETLEGILLTKGQSFLVVTDENGQVLARGEDKERIGDSLSDDALIRRALLGESAISVVTKDAALSPEVSVRASTSIKAGGEVIGTVMTGITVDNAFVDGVKSATGLESVIYGDNQISASTIVSADGKTRLIGLKEENSSIKEKVLIKGENLVSTSNILNVPYYSAYLPLKDVDNNPVGMLFVGKRQVGVLETAGKSIEATFIVAVILLILSIFPAYFISKYLNGQIR
jgi:hypothetical protein